MRTLERVAVAAILALGGLAALAHLDHWTAVAAFAVATVALGGSAWVVSFATEQLGERLGPAATGLLQATLGNLPELFVVIFALRAGELAVAQSAIVGSLFATSLLVLGVVVVVGALRASDGVMRFDSGAPRDASTLLLVCVFIIVIVGLSLSAGGGDVARHVRTISAIAAVLLLVVYLAWVIPYVRRDAGARHTGAAARIGLATALGLLVGAGVGAGFISDWFIDALRPAIHTLHISQAFAGLVIVAIASNAVEHVVGVVLAARRRSDLAISVVVNSVAQIAAFLFPALVLISLTMHTSLTFSLRPIYIGALAFCAIVTWKITEDGEGHPYEGLALVATYLVLAIITLYD
jgi:Ca2+:H+ antiporter